LALALLTPCATADKLYTHGYAAIANHTLPLWLGQCPSASPCCMAWRAKVARHFALLQGQYEASNASKWAHLHQETKRSWSTGVEKELMKNGKNNHLVGVYDLFEPTWNCDTADRMPPVPGDGPKWVCGLDALGHKESPSGHKPGGGGCLAYSFGSNGETSFEAALKHRVPHCAIYTFDPFLSEKAFPGSEPKLAKVRAAEAAGVLTFVSKGLVGVDTKTGRALPVGAYKGVQPQGLPIRPMMASLGHTGRVIDVLKVDIERSEFEAFADPDFFGGACLEGMRPWRAIGQLQLELHGFDFPRVIQLMERLHIPRRCPLRRCPLRDSAALPSLPRR